MDDNGKWIGNFIKDASNQNFTTVYFPVRLRTNSPTVTIYSPATGASGMYRNETDGSDQAVTVVNVSDSGFIVRPTGKIGVNIARSL